MENPENKTLFSESEGDQSHATEKSDSAIGTETSSSLVDITNKAATKRKSSEAKKAKKPKVDKENQHQKKSTKKCDTNKKKKVN